MKSLSKIFVGLLLIVTIAFGSFQSNANAASLAGTYLNISTGEKLQITDANDSNGSLKGSLSSQGKTLSLQGHYHFLNSTEPPTSISFTASVDDPNVYEAWAGTSNAVTFSQLDLLGIRSTLSQSGSTLSVLGGPFKRQ